MAISPHIDLHCHSIYSDGSLSPENLVEQASRAGLAAFSLTDHDTIRGHERADDAARRLSLNLISGVEISAECKGVSVHILGYFFDPSNVQLRESLDRVCAIRTARIGQIVTKLRALGVELEVDDVLKESAEGSWGRPHVARALLRKQLVSSFDEAFRRFLGNDAPAYVPRLEVSAAEAIDWLHAAGGVAVLAHPLAYRLKNQGRRESLAPLLDALVGANLDGMEVAYSNCSIHDSTTLMRAARARNLAFSGGSDFHGAMTPQVSLGIGRGNLRVPAAWLEGLQERRSGGGSRPRIAH